MKNTLSAKKALKEHKKNMAWIIDNARKDSDKIWKRLCKREVAKIRRKPISQ